MIIVAAGLLPLFFLVLGSLAAVQIFKDVGGR